MIRKSACNFIHVFLATLILASTAAAQVPNPPILDGAVVEPPPPAPPPPGGADVAIPGFTAVTVALNPTGNGTRYDVTPSDELTVVPWQSLKPGDVVNIFYRPEPYRHKILLSERGTAANPIVINGVTDANGNRPTIDGAGARTINPSHWHSAYRTTIILINKSQVTGSYGVNAEHYVIKNLRITGARARNSFVHDGGSESYLDSSRGIWSAGGQEISLEGMIIEDNGSGIFIQAADDPGALSKHWEIRGSKFENNGNGSRDHQIYFQAVSDPGRYNIVEGNYFGPATSTCVCAQLKTRSTGVVIRYNYFESAARTLDIVEAQDAIPEWMYRNYTAQDILDYYRSSHVYGNVINNEGAASRPLHFGADTLDHDATWGTGSRPNESAMRGDGSPTYFYFNTFRMNHDGYRGDLFDAENNNSNGPTPHPGTVEAWNNIFRFEGNSRIGVMNRSGTTLFRGANLLDTASLTIFAESDAYANYENSGDDPDVDVRYEGTIVTDPIGAAQALPGYMHPVEFQPNGQIGGTIERVSTNDIGAVE